MFYGIQEGSSLNLFVEDESDRASSGGTCAVKSIANYGPIRNTVPLPIALRPLTRAKSIGFSHVLYLDSVNRQFAEETSCCNIFIVKDSILSTPATNGAILPGVTRKSIIDIASDRGYKG
ncbi:hypothetical protein Nepgr_019836 [Nepenthes gracilis]|uniref:Branched-chain-amino-acid aminotransferase n=1 Tax=Nepenthes gracilis TaxID=150966 RepID=A0AAD3SVP6_NEPGR|nr:hypothetical protein Nepgr_019836 [Nepenthes gracilis]